MTNTTPEESQVPEVLEGESALPPEEMKKSNPELSKGVLSLFALVVILALIFGAFYVGTHIKRTSDAQKMAGGVVLSESQLHDLVLANHLTVYWAGPVPGDEYSLYVPKTGVTVVRYLPGGQGISDTTPQYRLVATYVQKGAFSTTQATGVKAGNLGFVNIDGNAVFYVKARPTNVFLGIKGADIQVEIFDPGQDQAVALSLFRGQIQQIK